MYKINVPGIAPLVYIITGEVVQEDGQWVVRVTISGGYPWYDPVRGEYPYPGQQAAQEALPERELQAVRLFEESVDTVYSKMPNVPRPTYQIEHLA